MVSKIKVGKIYKSNNYGEFKVIDKSLRLVPSGKRRRTYYLCEFLLTGYSDWYVAKVIREGTLKDYKYPIIHGVGYLGEKGLPSSGGKYAKTMYNRWKKMLSRCYDLNDQDYKNYGGVGISVDERWFSFNNFMNDCREIDGFDEELIVNGNLMLDKDFSQYITLDENKIYNKETCKWVTPFENAQYKPHYQIFFKAISPNGEETFHYNQKDFSRLNNLKSKSVGDAIRNNKSYFGWTFEVVTKEEYLKNKQGIYTIN